MKPINLTYLLIALLSLLYCSCDDSNSTINEEVEGVPVTVDLMIAPLSSATTRWTDSNALDSEMMQNWTIVVTDVNDKIESILSSSYTSGVKEEDYVTNVVLTTGNKRFYSFANIALSSITSSTPAVGSTLQLKPTCAAFVNGNIPSGGIPMSNIQTIKVANLQQQTIELRTIRMMAKVTLKLANACALDVKLNSITLNSITAATAQIATLPPATLSKYDIVANYTYTLASPITIAAGTTSANAQNVTCYINESMLSSADTPHYFMLSLNTDQGSKTQELRYALLNWQTFKRNQYSVIPITLDDYKLSIKVVDYPPIGVYPASVTNNSDGSFTCTFSSNGDFEISPTITKYSDGSSVSYVLTGMAARSVPTGFFVTAPTYNSTTKEIIGNIGNSSGTALYELTFNALKTDGTVARTLTYQLYIKR